MEVLKVEILNPRAKKLLQDLAALELIRFKDQEDSKIAFRKLLMRLRVKRTTSSTLKQINREVEAVRQKRYGT